MVISLNLNLSCAQPGEGHFLNLTAARSSLTLVEDFAGFEKTFLRYPNAFRGQSLQQYLRLLQIERVEAFRKPAVDRSEQFRELAAACPVDARGSWRRLKAAR
jgi:hypothetical protein